MKVGAGLETDGEAGLADADPLIGPASFVDFFFFVMLLTKLGPSTNWCDNFAKDARRSS